MKRRQVVCALPAFCLAGATGPLLAQPVRREGPARVAILDDAQESLRAAFWARFRKRLAEFGYTQGKDLVIDARYANGDLGRLDALATEIVATKPDVLVVVTTTVALAAKKVTSQVPIIALGPADPVKSGLVASLSRPGGNLTGASNNQAEIAGKWLELMREIVPGVQSFAYLTDTGNPGEMLVFHELEACARPFGIEAIVHDGVTAANVDKAFAAIAARRTHALIVATTASLLAQRQQIIDAAARARIAAIYARPEYAAAGGLVAYGADTGLLADRAADYVNRILRGTRPADLPFEMASAYRLVLNMRTAHALAIAIPQSIRVRADEIVE
jgi:putative ABC transport system substrate-binding protein